MTEVDVKPERLQSKRMMNLIFLVIFNLSPAFADSPKCKVESFGFGQGMRYQDITCKNTNMKMVSLRANNKNQYRKMITSEDGSILIFNNINKKHGSRAYYLFPFKEETKLIDSQNRKSVRLRHSSGTTLNIDGNGNLSSPDLTIKSDPRINESNQGGVVFLNYKNGILFDLGYKANGDPASYKNTDVKITDPNNKTCKVKNKEINTIDSSSNHKLKYKINAQIKEFLRKRCPSLDLSSFDLQNTTRSNSSSSSAIK